MASCMIRIRTQWQSRTAHDPHFGFRLRPSRPSDFGLRISLGLSPLACCLAPRRTPSPAPAHRLRLSRRRPAGRHVPGHRRRAVPERRHQRVRLRRRRPGRGRRVHPAADAEGVQRAAREAEGTAGQTGRRGPQRQAARRTAGSQSHQCVWTAADEKTVAEIRAEARPASPQADNANPAIAETVTLRVTLAPDAEPGERELRLGTPTGLSNPLRFCVGQLPEFTKREPKTVPDAATFRQLRFNNEQKAVAPTEMNITLPAVVNGQILPGGVDRYRFQARKGQQLVVAASARELIPYLADAVPGWFQATLTLYDAKGHELAYADDYRFHPDPVLHYEIPKDGEYVLEIKDSIYRGREDFVYRITVGELPFVTSIFPLGGPAGAQTTVELKGWNLPATSLTQDERQSRASIRSPCARRIGFPTALPFAVDTLPECLEQEPNNTDRQRPAGHAARHRQRPHRSAGRLGRVPLRGPRRRRRSSPKSRPPAGFAAGFGAQADRRRRQATGLQRRPRGQGRGPEHAPRGFLPHAPRCPRTAPTTSTSATRSTRAARSTPTACASARRGPISSCASCRPASTSAAAPPCPSPSMPCARTASPTRSRLALKDAPAGFTLSGAKVPGEPGPGPAHADGPARAPRDEPVQPLPGRPRDRSRAARSSARPCRPRT